MEAIGHQGFTRWSQRTARTSDGLPSNAGNFEERADRSFLFFAKA
jgi:hypothetical protein